MTYDYDGILEELKTRLALMSNWSTTIFHGTYERLLSVIAYIMEKLVYIAEFLYRESNFNTAEKVSSIMAKVSFLDYTPYRKVGASGYIQVNANSAMSSVYTYTGYNVTIPQWTLFSDSTRNINVYTTEEAIYRTGQVGSLSIPVKEGVPKQYNYTAVGIADEKIYIYSDSTDNAEIFVYVVDANNNILSQVSVCGVDVEDKRMYFLLNPDNYYCEISNANDFSYVQILFGNGINTKKLVAGERLLIKYAETKGTLGNIAGTNVITVFKNSVYDPYGTAVTLYVTNNAEISDAKDTETIESIKYNAPSIFQTGYRAGGSLDWIGILENYPIIHKAIVWSAADIGDYTNANINKVYIAAVSNDGSDLTTTQKDDITLNYLKTRKSITEVTSFETLNTIYAKFDVTAQIDINNALTVDAAIKDGLDAEYGILNNEFSTNIYESEFYKIVSEVPNILYHTTEVYTLEKGFEYSTGDTVIAVSDYSSGVVAADQIWLQPATLEIWVETLSSGVLVSLERAGYDTSGAITSDNGYTLSSTGVNYTTNSFQFVINDLAVIDPDDYNVNVSYKTIDGLGNQSNNLRVSLFNQIVDVDTNYIETVLTYG